MKITKRGHACLEISDQDRTLLIDPGSYTEDLGTPNNLDAIVITHAHEDHCFEPQLQRLLAANPSAEILGPAEVIARLDAATEPEILAAKKHRVFNGDHYKIVGFELDFMGDLHQVIHSSLAQLQNTGVLVNRALYYPGDSYTVCDFPYRVLACPSSAPWLRISEVIDFLDAMRPARCFATHNALLSERGHALQNSRIREVTQRHGGEFRYLDLGESWDV